MPASQETVQSVSPSAYRELIVSRRHLIRKIHPATLEPALYDPETGEVFVMDQTALDSVNHDVPA